MLLERKLLDSDLLALLMISQPPPLPSFDVHAADAVCACGEALEETNIGSRIITLLQQSSGIDQDGAAGAAEKCECSPSAVVRGY